MSARRDLLTVYLKGFAMGAADAVPGVSGGTIALITGIYDRLVGAIAALDVEDGLALLRDLVRVYDADARTDAWSRAGAMDLPFLVVLAVGVVSAALTAANVIEWAVGAHAGPTYAFFFGLIVASVVVLRDELSLSSLRGWVIAAAGFALAFVVSGSFQGSLGDGLVVLFVSGAIAICAMVLPGISGSLVLLIIGAYDALVGAVSDITHVVLGAADGGSLAAAVAPLSTLVVFAAGALVGILTFARVVSWAIDAYRVTTMTFLVGVMLGALRTPVREITGSVAQFTPTVLLGLVVAGVAGVLVVLGLEYVTGGIE